MSTNPQLSFGRTVDGLAGRLRADQIRRDTLLSLATAWGNDDTRDDVIAALDALDALADAMRSPREGELDALVEEIEGAASMDDAAVDVRQEHLLRLSRELDTTIAGTVGRFNPAVIRRGAA